MIHKQLQKATLTINESAVLHNVEVYRRLLATTTKIMAVVKAEAYGSGSVAVSQALALAGVEYLCVAYIAEGILLRKKKIVTPILVLNPTLESLPLHVTYNLEPEIYSLHLLNAWYKTRNSKKVPFQIKLDTGMHRLGFSTSSLPELCKTLVAHPQWKVSGILSHLAASEAAQHDGYTLQQAESFKVGAAKITACLGYTPLLHLLNSGGISRWPQYQFDMVRLGIGLYGEDENGTVQAQLQHPHRLSASISQIMWLKKGETVGYNRNGLLLRDSKIATINIGYADGFLRAAGNGKLNVFVAGQPAPTVGNICMDMSMIDITDIDDAKPYDEAEIFGPLQPLANVAKVFNTISYEILTSVSARVERNYVTSKHE